MRSSKRNRHIVRGPRSFARSAVVTYVVLALAACSDNGDNGGNQNQAGSTVSTNGTAGQNNGSGGAIASTGVGGTTGTQGSAGKVTTSSGGSPGTKVGTGGKGGTKGAAGNGGKGGTKAAAGAGGGTAGAGAPDVACDPKDKTADPTPATMSQTNNPPTGPYKVTVEVDPSLPKQTEIRPELKAGVKHPIIAWGNTACSDNSLFFPEFLTEIASHGFLIIDAGTPTGMGSVPSDASYMTEAIDWAFKENERPCSQYYHKLDTTKVAAMGQSCGGLMTYAVAGDPRLTTVILWDSGNLTADTTVYDRLHTPIAFFYGGTADMAHTYAEADFDKITKNIPVFSGHQEQYGHYTTIDEDNGGEYAQAGVAWLKWQLMGDQGATGKLMFAGANCGLCHDPWVIRKKNID